MPRSRRRSGRFLRVGQGGIGGITTKDVTGPGHEPNLYVRGGTAGEGGLIGAANADGSQQVYMSAQTHEPFGAGPHIYLNTAIDRPDSEYWYTEIVHKRDNLHLHAEGVETYETGAHYFNGPVHTDDGVGNLTFSYTYVIDRETGHMIFNPDPGAVSAEAWDARVEVRSSDPNVRLMVLKGDSGQASNLLTVENDGGTEIFTVGPTGTLSLAGSLNLSGTFVNASSDHVINFGTNGKIRGVSTGVALYDAADAAKLAVGTGGLGFYGTVATAKQTVTGSRGGNAALASLLTALHNIGLITNSSSA